MTKLLLTSVCRPFGGPGEGDSVGAELFHAQVTRAQGPFSLRQVIRVWAIDYLAQNIRTPTVTLHYPSHREFVRELKAGGYTHVGINFVVATFHKVREMVALIRRHAPGAKIILGGYGTVLPDAILQDSADYICREEGIGFLRKLFGEPHPAPIKAAYAPVASARMMSFQPQSVVGHITAGLGCPNGCDFCCTSHFFEREYVRFCGSGRDIYEAILATQKRADAEGVAMNGHVIIDEDFFLFKKRAREFLDCVREGDQVLQIMGFGSIRGLSNFTAREVAEMGFTLIWNAFEGKSAGYRKQQGRPIAEVYRDLKATGCGLLTSMIIGFPYQDRQAIETEFGELMELEPSLTQCLIYFAFPGTPFHDQVIAEGRYRDIYRDNPDFRRWDGFAMHFNHPKFADPTDVERLQRWVYDEDFRRLGPSVMRLARVWLEGYLNLRNDPEKRLRRRAETLRNDARMVLPVLAAVLKYPPSPAVYERAQALRADIIRHTGALSAADRAGEAMGPVLYRATEWLERHELLQQPALLRTEHNMGSEGADGLHASNVLRVSAGLNANPAFALAEDAARHARSTVVEAIAKWRRKHAAEPVAPHAHLVTQQSHKMPASVWASEAAE